MLEMKFNGKVSKIEEKTSKRGNDYVTLTINQGDSWLTVMVDKTIKEKALGLEAGNLVLTTLSYDARYKNFVISSIE